MLEMKYLEISLVEHCNLNCKSCSHFSPIAEEEYIDVSGLQRDLWRMSELFQKKLHMMRLMGGEPLLHPSLIPILQTARQNFPETHIQLVTNGLLLPKLSEEFYRCCDENQIDIHITIYPIKNVYPRILEYLNTRKVKYSVASNSMNKEKTFHHLVIDKNGGHDGYQNFNHFCSCSTCTNLSKGKLYLCPVRASIKHFVKYFDQDIKLFEEDEYDIYKKDVSVKNILEFLSKPTPFCGYCNCQRIQYGQQWERSKKSITEWT